MCISCAARIEFCVRYHQDEFVVPGNWLHSIFVWEGTVFEHIWFRLLVILAVSIGIEFYVREFVMW